MDHSRFERPKLRSLRERFEEEYMATTEPCDNRQGFRIKYVYYGNWHIWNLPEEQLKKVKIKVLVLLAADIVLFALAALLPSDVNSHKYVAFPGIIAVLALALKTLGVFQFLLAKYRTTKSNFEDAGRRIRFWSIVQVACTVLSSIGCIYCIYAFGFVIYRLMTALLYALDAAACVLIFRTFVKIPVKVEKNDVLEHVERVTMDD